MGSASTVTAEEEEPIRERHSLPIARLQPPILPKGAVLTNLTPLLSVEEYTKEVKEMEVQRIVIRPMAYQPPVDGPTISTLTAEVQPLPQPELTVTAETQADETAQASTPKAPQESTAPQASASASASGFDVSTLLGPDLSRPGTKGSSSRIRTSLTSNNNDSASTLAPPTPGSTPSDGRGSFDTDRTSEDGSERDCDTETETEKDDPAADYADTDDEVDVPLPLFLVRDGQADDLLGTVADEDDLAWADVAPPTALSEIPALPGGAEVPELLREIVSSSLESVQAQLAVAVAEKAERDKVKAAEAEAAAAARAEEKRRRQEQLEKERRAAAALSKGKARDTATRHMPEPIDLRPPPPVTPALPKKSKRHMFASRMLRHVHVLGGSSDRGESSAAGAAAAAEAAQAAQAAAARAALQRAYEQAQLRQFGEGDGLGAGAGVANRTNSSVSATSGKPIKRLSNKMARSSTRTRQQAYEQAMLRTLEGSSSIATPAAFTAVGITDDDATTAPSPTTTLPATAPLPTQRRAAMLLAMVRKDMEKQKEPAPPPTIECISCFEDVPRKEAVQTVCHAYCMDCFQQLVTTALANEAQFPPKCCLNEVPSATVTKYVPRDLARQYKDKVDEFAMPIADRVYCPTVDCGVYVPPAHVAKVARIARCRNGHETCTACRQPAHGRGADNREACPEASAQDRRDQQLADELAAEEGWRRCIRCAVIIEHREACQHMTCRCGAEFCYVCGLVWHTCRCSMDDLARIKREADARRVQRTAREARERERVRRQAEQADAELAELRDALAQVAAFEQRERQKLQRIQQAQRARLQRLRQQREVELAAEVAAKYDALRTTLAQLGAAQAMHAQQARRQERVAHGAQQTHDAADADARVARRREETAAAAAAKIRAAEQHWKQDYAARTALEARLESEYRGLLEANAAWTGRDDHAHLVARALRAYQRTNDAHLDAYVQWRDRELAHTTFLAEEERAVCDEVRDALRAKHTVQARKDRRALQRRHGGERVWCRAVVAERARLLAEMEVVEQGLGLAGSASEADANLLMLLDLEENGGLAGENNDNNNNDSSGGLADDTEMSHLYAVMLADIAGTVEDLQLTDDEVVDDHESFYSLYADNNGNGIGSSSNNNDSNPPASGSSRFSVEYSWPFAADNGN
ncbi:hypothetical protein SPBR_00093 [Sporothrix brasiliensis 5110]|uniref:RBR-type E3 ubiquitin transferase n=1 Tax=Sporothrix brasiliensis 5110 TaxID=1398154 RepID=A0A0C2IVU1_9PEZI|nr:uncharacterized protein SPBR_00093 [Sporothrix brasiliensis 5110]KIH90910.1 hypothetical protein SPBR_00093 [Sporothrix brasiliensis 5110]